MSSGARHFAVVGGGLGGSLAAVLLARAGHAVDLFERRDDPRSGKAPEGRSINLAISTRGITALDRAGLAAPVLAASVPMRGRMIHGQDGRVVFQPYGTRAEDAIHSVSRAELNRVILEAALDAPRLTVQFRRRCTAVDLDAATARFEDLDTGGEFETAAEALVGADGAFSAVRRAMQARDRFDFSQSYLGHGYKELSIPAGPGGAFALAPEALHIWPRGGFMMIALPNRDGSFTCTCFWAWDGPHGFAALKTPDAVRRYFAATFPDAAALMPTLAEDYVRNPTASLVTIRCHPWHHDGRAVLLGDAAHAVVPFYGQGANAAFEDCVALADAVAASPDDLERAFTTYAGRRKRHADALAELAVENFLEMRDRTASRLFRLRKRAEKLLHRALPRWYLPLYSMISFSTIPYDDARRRARRQDRAVVWAGVALGVALAAVAWIASID